MIELSTSPYRRWSYLAIHRRDAYTALGLMAPPRSTGMTSITVLSVNTHKGFSQFNRRFTLHDMREAIRASGADIVFLQEVVGENVTRAGRVDGWPKASHYEFLADEVWSDFAYAKNAVYPAGHHGNAILSRFPIEFSQQIDVSASRFEQRGILYARVRHPSITEPLHLVCVHFGLIARWRRQQLAKLINLWRRECAEQPTIIAGDFNDWTKGLDDTIRRSTPLVEVFERMHGAVARSFPARLPLFSLDRIYCSGLAPREAECASGGVWRRLSDHVALRAVISHPGRGVS